MDGENNKPGFEWYLTNAKTGEAILKHNGYGDANYETGAPVGYYYYITLHCEPANCDAIASLTVLK
mgnify:CR=1 FL=1